MTVLKIHTIIKPSKQLDNQNKRKTIFENLDHFQKYSMHYDYCSKYIVLFLHTFVKLFRQVTVKGWCKVTDPLIKEIKKRMIELDWENKDLAQATGFKTSTINAFFANLSGRDRSQSVCDAICRTLQIEC